MDLKSVYLSPWARRVHAVTWSLAFLVLASFLFAKGGTVMHPASFVIAELFLAGADLALTLVASAAGPVLDRRKETGK